VRSIILSKYSEMAKKTKRKLILWLILIFVAAGILFTFNRFYGVLFRSNIDLGQKESVIIYIPSESDFDDVVNILLKDGGLISEEHFRLTATQKGYSENVKPGKYRIYNQMSNNALVNKLRSGNQEPVQLVINNVRTMNDLAEKVASQLEFSTNSLLPLLKNDSVAKSYGFTVNEFPAMFIPNTYEVFWNISPEKFIERMKKEYDKFWTDERIEKAAAANLTPIEVSILGSIVISETVKRDEMPRIAGLYINRLNRGMHLEADPTVKFAMGDFELKRILFRHLEYDSPYNTYKYPGLPPGPIYFADAGVLDAVLNYEKHDYIFMCAKEDFSGYHNFAKTNAEHERNAARYHAALNRQKK
jgi:UPF0755 protein